METVTNSSNAKITILGAGISGLTTAYWLQKAGIDFTILEKNEFPGGSMESVNSDGVLFDQGPNSGLETTPLIKQLVEELELTESFIYANKTGNKRYILKEDKLQELPMSLKGFVKTELFSTKAKLRLFLEPFIGRSKDGYYQSIAQFVQRRLGREFLDYAINPFVAGVYAGKPEELSVKSAFPKLYALEEKYGGLMIGTVRSIRERKRRKEVSKQSAKMFSFKNGMQTLPLALYEKMKNRVFLNTEVTEIIKEENGYLIKYRKDGICEELHTDIIVSTIPAYILSKLMSGYDKELSNRLNSIYHPPVMVLFAVYKRADISIPLDGFGFLIPAKEKKDFLGAIWSSVIFSDRTPEDKACFTIFVGGSRNADIFTHSNDFIVKTVIKEFNEVMGISTDPESILLRFWEKAIPQYNIGYIEHKNYFEKFESENRGFILSGNYRGGISVGDCIKNSEIIANKVKSFLN